MCESDADERWTAEGKLHFQKCVRRNESCKQIMAFNIYPDNLVGHVDMIS